ncbi:myb/SANT-like DNA-binding domain-containing protein 4 isoform X2 [Stegodyphus dumicola]|uniref:myb/SANT-like DNA-binding domain-containing protein 4 isoform X2 n=1 Tax=Stegodyphus dumicola TaxID=202533 RepID=UPI0015ADE874|nr:myb/SANT-like DNA-binding domain-containing protein 4 isoform X2 [Stegodyphus dumicola]
MGCKRAENYNPLEVMTLLSCIENKPELAISNLGGTCKTLADIDKAWDQVAAEISSLRLGVKRSGSDIKRKWIDLKCRTKKKAEAIEKEPNKEGGQKLSEVEKRVLSVLRNLKTLESRLEREHVVSNEITPVIPNSTKEGTVIYLASTESVRSEKSANYPTPQTDQNLVSRPVSTSETSKRKSLEEDEEDIQIIKLIKVQRELVQQMKEKNHLQRMKMMLKCMKQNVSFTDLYDKCKK